MAKRALNLLRNLVFVLVRCARYNDGFLKTGLQPALCPSRAVFLNIFTDCVTKYFGKHLGFQNQRGIMLASYSDVVPIVQRYAHKQSRCLARTHAPLLVEPPSTKQLALMSDRPWVGFHCRPKPAYSSSDLDLPGSFSPTFMCAYLNTSSGVAAYFVVL